jgi:hypothetical protein
MSLTAKESPKWEAKQRPRTGVREYGLEISAEVFWKLRVLVKGKNLADPDSPDKLTVSGQAETILREWIAVNHPALNDFWHGYEQAETDAIRHVAQSGNERQAQP